MPSFRGLLLATTGTTVRPATRVQQAARKRPGRMLLILEPQSTDAITIHSPGSHFCRVARSRCSGHALFLSDKPTLPLLLVTTSWLFAFFPLRNGSSSLLVLKVQEGLAPSLTRDVGLELRVGSAEPWDSLASEIGSERQMRLSGPRGWNPGGLGFLMKEIDSCNQCCSEHRAWAGLGEPPKKPAEGGRETTR